MCIYARIYVHICADAYMKGSNFIYVAYMLNIYVSIYVTYIFFPYCIHPWAVLFSSTKTKTKSIRRLPTTFSQTKTKWKLNEN